MSRYSYEDAIGQADLRLDGNQLLAYTAPNAYHGVTEGFQAYNVTSKNEEYYVAPESDMEAVVAYTEGSKVFILLKPLSPYHSPVWQENEQLSADKQVELIKAFNVFAHNHYSYGGHAPYIEVLSGVYAETTVPAPIGEAVVEEDLIIS